MSDAGVILWIMVVTRRRLRELKRENHRFRGVIAKCSDLLHPKLNHPQAHTPIYSLRNDPNIAKAWKP